MTNPHNETIPAEESDLSEATVEPGYYHGPTPVDEAEARIAYCRVIAQRCALALPGGRDPSADSAQYWPTLERVFVEPNTRSNSIPPSDPSAAEIPLFDALEQNRRLVILSLAGGGKTTALRRLALAFAGGCWQGLERWPESERDWLPVLVNVRGFARWLHAKPALPDAFAALLWSYISDDLNTRGLTFAEELLATAAEKGQALVLLDDLDYVTEPLQRTVLDTITDFAKSYHRARVLVTCRTDAYRRSAERLPEKRFPTTALAVWDHNRIERFILTWCEDLAARHSLPDGQISALTAYFNWAVEWSKRTLLTENPLLLTLIGAGINRHPTLSEQPALLVAQVVDDLLQQHPALLCCLQDIDLTEEDLLWVLGRIAAAAWEAEGNSEACSPALIMGSDSLVATLAELHPETDQEWARRLLECVRGTGLLVEQQPELYRFLHPAISTYLAGLPLALASGFVQQGLKLVQAHWTQARCLLPSATAYQAHRKKHWEAVWELVAALCEENTQEYDRNKAVWLAGEVLQAVGFEAIKQHADGTEHLTQVTHQLTALLEQGRLEPAERAQAAECLGSLGDPRFGQKRLYLPCRYQEREESGLGFVTIPAGTFWMGSSADDPDADANEFGNTNPLLVPYVYWMARYPVTVAQYGVFVDSGGYADADAWWREDAAKDWLQTAQRDTPVAWGSQRQHPHWPVTGITWFEARAYCGWLDNCLRIPAHSPIPEDYEIRLPTEAEWEKAARCASRAPYPWGTAAWESQRANVKSAQIGHPTPVGLYPQGATVNGLHDLAGNVWEWTLSSAGEYPYEPYRNGSQGHEARIARGGSWNDPPAQARCPSRVAFDGEQCSAALGFRVVVSVMHSAFSPHTVF